MTALDQTALDRTALDLTGLTTRPAQTWGAVRLVPLVREQPITDLRLHQRVNPMGGEYPRSS